MKIIDAFWERRNLGVESTELYFERRDQAEYVTEYLKNPKSQYEVAFIPIDRTDLSLTVQELGFRHIESNFDLLCRGMTHFSIPSALSSLAERSRSKELEKNQNSAFLEKLKNEFIFEKDKISLDPCFTPADSSNRNYWRTMDYINENKDIRIYITEFENKDIGYFILLFGKTGVAEVYLSGLFPDTRATNLGACIVVEETKTAFGLGAKAVSTGVSLNNISSLRIYLSLGYEIKKATNILIRHSDIRRN